MEALKCPVDNCPSNGVLGALNPVTNPFGSRTLMSDFSRFASGGNLAGKSFADGGLGHLSTEGGGSDINVRLRGQKSDIAWPGYQPEEPPSTPGHRASAASWRLLQGLRPARYKSATDVPNHVSFASGAVLGPFRG